MPCLHSFTLLSESKMTRNDSLSTVYLWSALSNCMTVFAGEEVTTLSLEKAALYKEKHSWWCKRAVASSVESEHWLVNPNISLVYSQERSAFPSVWACDGWLPAPRFFFPPNRAGLIDLTSSHCLVMKSRFSSCCQTFFHIKFIREWWGTLMWKWEWE